MKQITIEGLISKIFEKYVVTADDGTQYELSAIMPYEAVAEDYGTGEFAEHLGRRMSVTGLTDGQTIYDASLQPLE